MQYPFHGQTAIVTGGANGIGRAIAEKLLRNGASVVALDISPGGEELSQRWQEDGLKAAFVHTDVRSESQLTTAVALAEERFGGVDILINSAGIFPRAGLLDTTEALWDKIMDINAKGVYLACKTAVPALARRGGGVIINIGSLNTFGGEPDLFAYAASKGSISSMTLNLARSLAEYRIRVNCVHPGWVVTESELAVQRLKGRPDGWVETEGAKMPYGRLQTPEDIASTVVFLASHEANQITGQSICVDGGLSFQH